MLLSSFRTNIDWRQTTFVFSLLFLALFFLGGSVLQSYALSFLCCSFLVLHAHARTSRFFFFTTLFHWIVLLGASSFFLWLFLRLSALPSFFMILLGSFFAAICFPILQKHISEERLPLPSWMQTLPFFLVTTTLFLYWNRPLNPDAAWYVLSAHKWLQGAMLYRDIVEINPPLNFYLTLPVVFLEDVFHLPPYNAYYLWVCLLFWGSLLLCLYLLSHFFAEKTAKPLVLLLGIFAAILFPTIFLKTNIQREHLFLIFIYPWILWSLLTHNLFAHKHLIFLLAAIGLCLKPYFFVLPMIVVLTQMVFKKSFKILFSIQNAYFLGAALLYVLFIYAVHPLYFQEVIPTAKATYYAFESSTHRILSSYALPKNLFMLGAVCLWTFLFNKKSYHIFAPLMITLSGGVITLLQNKGFTYHQIPFFSFLLFSYFWLLCVCFNPMTWLMSAYVIFQTVFGTQLLYLTGLHNSNLLTKLDLKIVNASERFITFSSNIAQGPSVALHFQKTWASRHPSNWFIPGAVNFISSNQCEAHPKKCATMHDLLNKYRAQNIEDLQTFKPDLIIFEKKSIHFDAPFDWLAFLSVHPQWSTIFSHYSLEQESSHFYYYRLTPVPPSRRLHSFEAQK